jgi:hypothetical protein
MAWMTLSCRSNDMAAAFTSKELARPDAADTDTQPGADLGVGTEGSAVSMTISLGVSKGPGLPPTK